jgi:hypothetical protein
MDFVPHRGRATLDEDLLSKDLSTVVVVLLIPYHIHSSNSRKSAFLWILFRSPVGVTGGMLALGCNCLTLKCISSLCLHYSLSESSFLVDGRLDVNILDRLWKLLRYLGI